MTPCYQAGRSRRLILETLGNRELTASEITEELVAAGRIPYFNRNYVAPRLTELKEIGILTMPLRDNVPEPPTDDWQLTTCPVCGAECWQTDTARRILALEPDVRTACTACALKGLGK